MAQSHAQDPTATEQTLAEMANAIPLSKMKMWSPPDPAAEQVRIAEQQARQEAETQAKRAEEAGASRQGALYLREFSAGTYLSTIVTPVFGDVVPPAAVQLYRTRFLSDSKVSGDPIETALIEEFVLIHHTACKLLGMSCDLTHATVISEIGGVAARFLAESRRLAQAIQAYRQQSMIGMPASKRKRANAKDAALPSTGNAAEVAAASAAKKNNSGARLTSNGHTREAKKEIANGTPARQKAQSSSRCRRSPQPGTTWSDDGRRPQAAAATRTHT